VSAEKKKSAFDEQTLAKLLEAAYVLQEHNRELRKLGAPVDRKTDHPEADAHSHAAAHPEATETPSQPATQGDYTVTLAKIVETQHHIQVRRLELEAALKLIADRVVDTGRANGAGIGIVSGETARYRAVSGTLTPDAGSTVPVDKSPLASCVKTSQVFRCPDVHAEVLLDAQEYSKRGIQSLIAVPIFHGGGVVGGLELYYATPHAFTEQDVHTCQLMAGLVTEALAHDDEESMKKTMADERAAMLDALEKLQPNLASLVEKPRTRDVAPATVQAPAAARESARLVSCRKCSHQLTTEEQFCGQCGTPRSGDYEPPSMQSKVASLWQMHELQMKESGDAKAAPSTDTAGIGAAPSHSAPSQHEPRPADSIERPIPLFPVTQELAHLDSRVLDEPIQSKEISSVEEEEAGADVDETTSESNAEPQALARTEPVHPANWTSAASAREFLEQLASKNRKGAVIRFWNSHRGDVYLAIAVVLVLCVIRWGIWSSHSVAATNGTATASTQQKPSHDSDLSLFDRILIQLGLAEAPEPPADKGSPGVQVWVDTQTALYYCPGTDLYGKTAKGKFTTQREAQLDQFEPAYRKTCN